MLIKLAAAHCFELVFIFLAQHAPLEGEAAAAWPAATQWQLRHHLQPHTTPGRNHKNSKASEQKF